MRPNNRGLVDDLPTLLYRPCCRELPRPRTPCCRLHLVLWLFSLTPSLWCLASAVTYEKRHESSISLVAPICRFICLPGVEL